MLKLGTKVDDMLKAWTKADDAARIEGVKRLGLPANNTAADRAKAMGFSDETYYHGTNNVFDGFNVNQKSNIKNPHLGKSGSREAVYVTKDPDIADMFTTKEVEVKRYGEAPEVDWTNEGAQILPLKIRDGNIFDYKNANDLDKVTSASPNTFALSDETKDFASTGYWQAMEDKALVNNMKELGFDGYKANEGSYFEDAFNSQKNRNISNVDNTAMFNSDGNIRSPLAHFNPKMAGVGAGAVMSGNLMADELDLEYKGQEPSTWDSLMNTIGGVNQEQAQAYGDTGAGTMEGTANIAHMLATDPAVAGEVIGGGALSLAGATSPWIKGFGAGLLLDSGEASASPKYSDEDFIKKLEGR